LFVILEDAVGFLMKFEEGVHLVT